MAVPEVKHNRGEKLNAENLRAALGNQPVPHRFLLIRPHFSKGCVLESRLKRPSTPCPETSLRTASITATAGLGHHPSLAIKEIWITVSRFRLSGTDRRNNSLALIASLTVSIQDL